MLTTFIYLLGYTLMEMGKEAANYRVTIMFKLYVRYFMVIILFNPLNTLEKIDKQIQEGEAYCKYLTYNVL